MTLSVYQILALFFSGCVLGWILRIIYEYMKGEEIVFNDKKPDRCPLTDVKVGETEVFMKGNQDYNDSIK